MLANQFPVWVMGRLYQRFIEARKGLGTYCVGNKAQREPSLIHQNAKKAL